MTRMHHILREYTRRFIRDESATTLVEFTIVLALFFLIFFGLMDFGRLAFHFVTAEKAIHVAARVAAVRPPACAGVPQTNARGPVGPTSVPPKFGTSCSSASDTCANPGTIACDGSGANATANEIFNRISGALPNNATISNLRFIYTYDSNLGFLGGPYVPVVTVELQNLQFEFVFPLAGLANMVTNSTDSTLGGFVNFPSMSVSLPAEDLAMGNAG